MRAADSRIEVATIMRSAGSPGKSLPNCVALTVIGGVSGSSSTFGKAKACSNHGSVSLSRLICPFATKVATSRQLIADAPIRVSAPDFVTCRTAKLRGFADSSKPGVRIEHDHCSISHLFSIGFTILPWNLTLPRSFRDVRVSVGTTLATGLPRLVTISGWRVRATLSRSAKQWALNSPAGTVLGGVVMGKLYDQHCFVYETPIRSVATYFLSSGFTYPTVPPPFWTYNV